MMRSLYAGVAGLKTHQTKMDVIGNNIANVNTTAYKSQSITFSELMYQTTQSASGANASTGVGGTNARQIGLGVKSGAINTAITSQGSSQTTNNPFDIMITGDAFFVVSNGQDNFFTRDGSFYVDGAGNLAMTSTGYNVMGWQVDPTTQTIKQDTVSALKIMTTENMTYPPEATTQATVSGIVDKKDTNVNSADGRVMNLEFYNDLGYKYTAKMSIHAIDGDSGQFYVKLDSIVDSTGKAIDMTGVTFGGNVTYPTVQTATTSGTVANPDSTHVTVTKSGTTAAFTNVAVNTDATVSAADVTTIQELYGITVTEGATYSLAADGTITVTTTETATNSAALNFNASTGVFQSIGGNTGGTITLGLASLTGFKDITMDFTSTSNYNNNGSSTIGAVTGDEDGLGSGRKIGEMSGVTIQKDGMIYAAYDNGQTRLLGQIAVASFANASGLAKEGDNLYSATLNSGAFDGIGVDITSGGGYMNTGVLEMSNVDLSSEFTEMITTQRGFQANSRIITVSDTLLEELTNLKR